MTITVTALGLLLTAAGQDTLARQRLAAVAGTRDGFALAEVDLQQRREGGGGDALAERGDHAAGDEDEPRHGSPS